METKPGRRQPESCHPACPRSAARAKVPGRLAAEKREREKRWCDRQSSQEMRVRLWGGAHPWAISGTMPYTHYLLVALPLSLGAGEWGPTTQCSGVLPQDQKAFFPSEPCPSPAPWPWVSHVICLGFSFLICMLGTKPVLVSQGCCKV